MTYLQEQIKGHEATLRSMASKIGSKRATEIERRLRVVIRELKELDRLIFGRGP